MHERWLGHSFLMLLTTHHITVYLLLGSCLLCHHREQREPRGSSNIALSPATSAEDPNRSKVSLANFLVMSAPVKGKNGRRAHKAKKANAAARHEELSPWSLPANDSGNCSHQDQNAHQTKTASRVSGSRSTAKASTASMMSTPESNPGARLEKQLSFEDIQMEEEKHKRVRSCSFEDGNVPTSWGFRPAKETVSLSVIQQCEIEEKIFERIDKKSEVKAQSPSAKAGVKVGAKAGVKVGAKVGVKAGVKVCAATGGKTRANVQSKSAGAKSGAKTGGKAGNGGKASNGGKGGGGKGGGGKGGGTGNKSSKASKRGTSGQGNHAGQGKKKGGGAVGKGTKDGRGASSTAVVGAGGRKPLPRGAGGRGETKQQHKSANGRGKAGGKVADKRTKGGVVVGKGGQTHGKVAPTSGGKVVSSSLPGSLSLSAASSEWRPGGAGVS